MSDAWGWWSLSLIGFAFSSVGGLGGELLDRFAGRQLEAYCRLKKKRERFGAVLDNQDAAIRGAAAVLGTVEGEQIIRGEEVALSPGEGGR